MKSAPCNIGRFVSPRGLDKTLIGCLTQEQTVRSIVEAVSDVDIRYDMGAGRSNRHPLLGQWAPNLALHTERGTTCVAELMHTGKGVFLDLAGRPALHDVAADWAGRVDATVARCYERPANLDALVVRPDGYVAWVATSDEGDEESQGALRAALEKWFGAACRRDEPGLASKWPSPEAYRGVGS